MTVLDYISQISENVSICNVFNRNGRKLLTQYNGKNEIDRKFNNLEVICCTAKINSGNCVYNLYAAW